ncbi:hypothetical protein [Spiroplasma endosymbiont of Acasis viretata]|uniref:hypothetical protein n=1 Tax=Spiroplasma endosymbiont of Acasis viretata TaxID=3066306 RepID=UPI00313DB062
MKFILKLLSSVILTSLSVINVNACGTKQGSPELFTGTFDKINKFSVSIINTKLSIPVMDLLLYKKDVIKPTGFLRDFYNNYGYIKFEIGGEILEKFLNIYGLNINNNEEIIENIINNTSIYNGYITIVKYASYVNFYYISGKISANT